MPSTKKPASSKRASFPREASYEKRFVKDWERLSRSGRYNMKQLKVRTAEQYSATLAAG